MSVVADRPWPADFETILSGHLLDGPPAGGMDPDLDLRAAGLDSVTTIGLMVDLEERFGFLFRDEALTAETFATPHALWTAVVDGLSAG